MTATMVLCRNCHKALPADLIRDGADACSVRYVREFVLRRGPRPFKNPGHRRRVLGESARAVVLVAALSALLSGCAISAADRARWGCDTPPDSAFCYSSGHVGDGPSLNPAAPFESRPAPYTKQPQDMNCRTAPNGRVFCM
jgi:hypothetical protein